MMTNLFKYLVVFAGFACVPGAWAQRIEETNAAFTYNGVWSPITDPNASGGAYTMSSTVGSTVTFQVTGTNFVLYRKMDTNGGYATVTVDGNNFGTLTFYAAQTVHQIPAAIDELAAGTHTIVLTVSQTQPTGSGGFNLYIDALQFPVPANLTATQPQMDAVTRTNFYRSLAGLPSVRHHLALGLAANAHAQYLDNVNFIANGSSPHVETLGASPFFTAAQPQDRDAYFGYTGTGTSEDSNNSADPINFVDGWIDGVYHREPYFIYSFTDIGFGGYPNGSTMDFGSIVTASASPNAVTYTTYPANNQTDVWLFYDGSDGPNNVTLGGTYGYPINLTAAWPATPTQGTATSTPTTGTLVDSSGNNIPVTIADSTIDNQLGSFFMIPNQPLNPSTKYTATMSGVDFLNNAFTQTWSFTTANPNSVHNVRAATNIQQTYLYNVNWDMPTMAVPSQLQYGPTTAYGTNVAGTNQQGTTWTALMVGVATMPVVHFRVTATDAQGNVYTSPDHYILNSTTVSAGTVGYLSLNPNNQDTSAQWETAGPVTSSVLNYGPSVAYGMTATAGLVQGGTGTQFYADIFNLPSGSSYHYQIVTVDQTGKTTTTPDAFFTVP